ncbi:MAG: hypothetical protein Fur0043_18280 [Anaerolineales bacterium]
MASQRRSLTWVEQEKIEQRKKAGLSLRAIAAELNCSFYTARKYWRRRRKQQVPPQRGRPARGILSAYPAEWIEQAIALKKEHPHWGAVTVRVKLAAQLGREVSEMPSRARLAALFKERCPEAVQSRQKQAYPEKRPPAVRYPHQRWQLDAQEGISAVQGEKVNLLNMHDPMGIMIGSQAFVTTTDKRWRKITLRETQNTLRTAFARWGLPEEIQTDHETIYVGSGESNYPSLFSVWLAGLGIRHVTSRPARPTDQAEMERSHRTLAELAWKDSVFDDVSALQEAIDREHVFYNEHYPAQAGECRGQPPLQAFPHARQSGRPFQPEQEWVLFDLQRAYPFVSAYTAIRQAAKNGAVCLLDHQYSVGARYAGQTVTAQFVPEQGVFRFRTAQGEFIRDLPARGLSKEDILGFAPASTPLSKPFQLPLPIPL